MFKIVHEDKKSASLLSKLLLVCAKCLSYIKVLVVTQGTDPKLTTIDRWPLNPGLVNYLYVWPICLCMIDIYRCYESCSSQNVELHLMHKHGGNKFVNNI